MQNGHLIEASTLKISAFLNNLILGRGFGSVFRHQIRRTDLLCPPFFLPWNASTGAGSGLAAKDAAAPDALVSGRFPFSDAAHSLFLRRRTSHLTQHWREFPAACSSGKPPSRRRPDFRRATR